MTQKVFAIYPVDVGNGVVALSPMPCRFGAYETDLPKVLSWAPDLVLTMTMQATLDRMGATEFGVDLKAADIAWRHLPIVDFEVPDAQVTALWDEVSVLCGQILARGGKILTHCSAGCGRSGMAALRLMIEAGEDPKDALIRLRAARPCAVETDAQFEWASRTSA
jgi:protein-tyrosine phosphatase